MPGRRFYLLPARIFTLGAGMSLTTDLMTRPVDLYRGVTARTDGRGLSASLPSEAQIPHARPVDIMYDESARRQILGTNPRASWFRPEEIVPYSFHHMVESPVQYPQAYGSRPDIGQALPAPPVPTVHDQVQRARGAFAAQEARQFNEGTPVLSNASLEDDGARPNTFGGGMQQVTTYTEESEDEFGPLPPRVTAPVPVRNAPVQVHGMPGEATTTYLGPPSVPDVRPQTMAYPLDERAQAFAQQGQQPDLGQFLLIAAALVGGACLTGVIRVQ